MTSTGPINRLIRSVSIIGRLLGIFLVDLTTGCVAQVSLVLRPRLIIRPHWIRYDSCLSCAPNRALLGILISLTPGTVTADLKGEELLIHVLDGDSDEEVRQAIRNRLEKPLSQLEELWL